MSDQVDRQSALTFRMARRRYALSLRSTAGVQDLGKVRRIPGAPPHWLGVADWGGSVVNVIDLPDLLEDTSIESVKSVVRLREPHAGIAVFVPAHLGLCELRSPQNPGDSALYTALGGGSDTFHWIHLDSIVAACSKQTVP